MTLGSQPFAALCVGNVYMVRPLGAPYWKCRTLVGAGKVNAVFAPLDESGNVDPNKLAWVMAPYGSFDWREPMTHPECSP